MNYSFLLIILLWFAMLFSVATKAKEDGALSAINELWHKGDKEIASSFDGDNQKLVWLSAAAAGRLDMLDWLLKNDIRGCESRDNFGANVWLYAASFDQEKVLGWLAQNKIEGMLAEDDDGNNIWLTAASSGSLKALEWLYQNGVQNLEHKNKTKRGIWEKAILATKSEVDSNNNNEKILLWLKERNITGVALLLENIDRIVHEIVDRESVGSLKWLLMNDMINRSELLQLIPDIWKKAALFRAPHKGPEMLSLLESHKVKGKKVLKKSLKEIVPTIIDNGAIGTVAWLFDAKMIDKSSLAHVVPGIWKKVALSNVRNKRQILEFIDVKLVPGRDAFIKSLPKNVHAILKTGGIDVMQWLLDNKFISKEKLARLVPHIWHLAARLDVEHAPLNMLQWLIKNEIPGALYCDKQGNNIWLVSNDSIDIADVLELLINYKISGFNQVNNLGQNVWLNAAQVGSLKALSLLFEHKIAGSDHVDRRGKNIWHYADRALTNKTQVFDWLSKNKVPGKDDKLLRSQN